MVSLSVEFSTRPETLWTAGVALPYNGPVIQIYGRKKCKITQKAERFFKERRIEYAFVNLDQKTPGRREIELFLEVLGEERVIDENGKAYSKLGLSYMAYDPVEMIEEHPELILTPIVRDGRKLSSGSDEPFWKSLAEKT